MHLSSFIKAYKKKLRIKVEKKLAEKERKAAFIKERS